ncbi:uncharacterized protein [Rutidosis leptorrhynchoides]|uniref:uncharacterized protein n=1 Tax=Rutidosis leptorrhynchoides TaxID=125765 RepID=UPI003A98EEA7
MSSSAACGVRSEKKKLDWLQRAMKGDAEGYVTELQLIYSQFKSLIEIYEQNHDLGVVDVGSAKELGDRAMLLAHLVPFYPNQLVDYPKQLIQFLTSSACVLPWKLRFTLAKALILIVNKKIVGISESLVLLMELQVLNDKGLKRLAFSHVIRSIGRMNRKHYNQKENTRLQTLLFSLLQEKDDLRAMRSLVTLCNLYRTKVWIDDTTSNAICRACFHPSSRIVVATLSFLLGYEKIEQDDDDSDDSSDQGETTCQSYAAFVSKRAIYKANSTGTTSSKKKKKAKLQRVIRSMKRQHQRTSSSASESNSNYSSPLVSLQDPQGFAEELFSLLQKKSVLQKKSITKMIVEVVARTIGLHRLILLDFYPYIENYVDRNQREVSSILAAAVQACHDMVPPDAVESLLKKVVEKLVHGCTRTESITLGLNVVREICVRIPLVMTEDNIQDLVLYKKSHSKAVSSAARSLISLFREICPSLLLKKDRGRPNNPKAKPKAFGEVTIPSDVPGADLLVDDDDVNNAASKEDDDFSSDPEDMDAIISDPIRIGDGGLEANTDVVRGRKRKIVDTDEQLDSAGEGQSLRALKKRLLVGGGAKSGNDDDTSSHSDGILSNEDFQRINELKAMKEARLTLASHGLLKKSSDSTFKIPSSEQLRMKRVDGYALQANIRKKMTKEQRKALIKAGREEIGTKYQAKSAIRRQKTGGLSNRQKEHKKAMPLAAKRSRIKRSKQHKSMKQRGVAGKQFRGRKAWK